MRRYLGVEKTFPAAESPEHVSYALTSTPQTHDSTEGLLFLTGILAATYIKYELASYETR